MSNKLLFNTENRINFIKNISSFETIIRFMKKSKKITTIETKIKSKNYNIFNFPILIRNPIKDIFSISGSIKEIKLNKLLEVVGFIKYEFKINPDDYVDYSELIHTNITDLSKRIKYLFYFTKNYLIQAGAEYVDETYMLTEDKFKLILSSLDSNNYSSYEDITDKVIMHEIIKYLRSNV